LGAVHPDIAAAAAHRDGRHAPGACGGRVDRRPRGAVVGCLDLEPSGRQQTWALRSAGAAGGTDLLRETDHVARSGVGTITHVINNTGAVTPSNTTPSD